MSVPVRPWSRSLTPVLTASQAQWLDAWAMQDVGVPQAALMERAGAAAAAAAQRLFPAGPVLVLVGKGNNGGDGLVAARTLAAWRRNVRILATSPEALDRSLLHGWPLPLAGSTDLSEDELAASLARPLAAGGVVLDGLLGTGVAGAPRGEVARVIRALLAASPDGTGVLSLDIPSGVSATNGVAAGDAVRAAATVCFGWPRMGCLLHPGRELAGRVLAMEIGFPPDPDRPPSDTPWAQALTPAWAAAHRPVRPVVTHKNAVGALAVIAGCPGMTGAAILAGRAALRSGAGYVRVVSAIENRDAIQAALPEAVFVNAGDGGAVSEALAASRALVAGPAMGTDAEARALLRRGLEAELPTVIDADAITLLAREGGEHPGLASLLTRRTVITPHPGEARRLLGQEELDTDPWVTAEALRERTGATVLLKGTPSVVLSAAAEGGERRFVDTLGSSDLAVAGMGDTLAGSVGAFLAQGVEPGVAAGLGLATTGRAAALAGMGAGLQSADVPEFIPTAMAEEVGAPELDLPGLLLDMDPPR